MVLLCSIEFENSVSPCTELYIHISRSCFHVQLVESRIRVSAGYVLDYELLDVTSKVFSRSDSLGICTRVGQRILVNSRISRLAVTVQTGL